MSQENILLKGENSVVDWILCVKLANNKPEVAQEILEFVLQQLPDDRDAIQQAYFKFDHSELLRSVHKLHGALCYTGLPRLKNLVFELESTLKQKDFDKEKLGSMMKNFEQELELVLKSEINKKP